MNSEQKSICPVTLPNGIQLPETWPPTNTDINSSQPQPVPYLDKTPEVIDVSLGRQLFTDDFLTESVYCNMARVDHKAVKYDGNPVFCPQSPEERHADFPACAVTKNGGVWFDDLDNKFKMWYTTGYLGFAALAISDDGIHWERPKLDVVPGTNLVLPKEIHPDSGSVIIDHETADLSQRYKWLVREPDPVTATGGVMMYPARLMVSPDGIHWKQIGMTGGCGDRATMFYNPFRKKWVQSIRFFDPFGKRYNARCRYYYEADDFLASGGFTQDTMIPWLRADNLDHGKFSPPQLYTFDAIAYESIMLGFHQILDGPPNHLGEKVGLPKLSQLHLSSRRDGFHWYRPDRTPFIGARREYGSWEYGYLESSAGMCLIVGDELWIYYSAYAGEPERITADWHVSGTYGNGAIGLAKLRRDGFASMRPMFAGALTQTRKLRFSGSKLFVNVQTAGSKLTVQAIDEQGKAIPGLTHEDCLGYIGNSTRIQIQWKQRDLSNLGNEKIRLQFCMDRGDLYSFWITDSHDGKSGGYVAAGGPGLTGSRDI